MNQKELAKLFNVGERNGEMKNKQKANEIISKMLKCNKCGNIMKWIRDTNVCFCPNCTYESGKADKKTNKKNVFNFYRTISDRNRKFLENNYDNFTKSEV